MKKKSFFIISLFLIIAGVMTTVYLFNRPNKDIYKFNLNSNNIKTIKYTIGASVLKPHYISITDKSKIGKICDLYKNYKFKKRKNDFGSKEPDLMFLDSKNNIVFELDTTISIHTFKQNVVYDVISSQITDYFKTGAEAKKVFNVL